ncbi:MAG: AAA family ATPase, partial [Spirochaetes bacterium]|nr:AAA family ATPase [Spirochaetota bacterium]
MFLKRIELFGFKSFAERAKIEFTDGISALLGPNGCGKSNVVDAIKWV